MNEIHLGIVQSYAPGFWRVCPLILHSAWIWKFGVGPIAIWLMELGLCGMETPMLFQIGRPTRKKHSMSLYFQ